MSEAKQGSRCPKCDGLHFGEVEGNCPLSADYVPNKPWPKHETEALVAPAPLKEALQVAQKTIQGWKRDDDGRVHVHPDVISKAVTAAITYANNEMAEAFIADNAEAPVGCPIPLNAEQEKVCSVWAADDRLWTTQETVAFNLRTFARSILAAALNAARPPARSEECNHVKSVYQENENPSCKCGHAKLWHANFGTANCDQCNCQKFAEPEPREAESPVAPAPLLLPCPFCGGEAYYTESVNGSRMVYAGCSSCGIAHKAEKVYRPGGDYLTKDVKAAWNKRAAQPPARSEAEERREFEDWFRNEGYKLGTPKEDSRIPFMAGLARSKEQS